jgi:hypothetical protein
MVTIGGIRTANGLGGTAADGVTPELMLSLLVILAFRGGGVGVGAHGLDGAGATGVTHTATDTTVMATRTAMAMDITATTKGTPIAANRTPIAANREWPSYSADLHVPVIIGAQSMEFWGHRRAGQSAPMSKTTDM